MINAELSQCYYDSDYFVPRRTHDCRVLPPKLLATYCSNAWIAPGPEESPSPSSLSLLLRVHVEHLGGGCPVYSWSALINRSPALCKESTRTSMSWRTRRFRHDRKLHDTCPSLYIGATQGGGKHFWGVSSLFLSLRCRKRVLCVINRRIITRFRTLSPERCLGVEK